MKINVEVTIIFDDVRFGIDVRDQREIRGWTQDFLGYTVGWQGGCRISDIERAVSADTISVRRYMALCNVLGLNPMHYWTCDDPVPVGGAEWSDVDAP